METLEIQTPEGIDRLPLQNTYAAKKTVAQGMMDVALVMANANQLRFVLDFNSESNTYGFILFLIISSLALQVLVGIALIFKGRCDLTTGHHKLHQANRINNFTLSAVFLITIINAFITALTDSAPAKARLLHAQDLMNQQNNGHKITH